MCDQVAHTDNLAECAGGLGLCADNLYKMSSDLLLYSSSLSGEIRQREVQYGSTIMPYKSNPVLLELIRGLTMDCSASAALIKEYSRSGQLQLNANLPFSGGTDDPSGRRLNRALDCAAGPLMKNLEPDRERMEARLAVSPALLNSLKDSLGYSGLKELIPRIKEASPANREELIVWLSENTALTSEYLKEKFNSFNLTSFDKGETL